MPFGTIEQSPDKFRFERRFWRFLGPTPGPPGGPTRRTPQRPRRRPSTSSAFALLVLVIASSSSNPRAQDDPAQTVKEADSAADGEEERGLSPLVIFQRFYERFDAEERFGEAVETGKARHRVVVIFWGNAVGEYVWNGETVRVLADRMAVLGQLNRTQRRGGEAATDAPVGDQTGEQDVGRNYFESPSFLAEGNVRLEFRDLDR